MKQLKSKTLKTIIISIGVVILAVICFFLFGRSKYYFVDTISDETYTTLYHWFWEDIEDFGPYVVHPEEGIMTSGFKKTKSGIGIFSMQEYEMEFDEAIFELHYMLDDDGKNVAVEEYKISDEDQPLRFDFETEETKAGKTIVGWKIDCTSDDCDVYTVIPAGSYGTVHLYPVYADAEEESSEAENTAESVEETETSENSSEKEVEVTNEE